MKGHNACLASQNKKTDEFKGARPCGLTGTLLKMPQWDTQQEPAYSVQQRSWHTNNPAVPECRAQATAPCHAPLRFVVAVVCGGIKDTGLAICCTHVARPHITMQHTAMVTFASDVATCWSIHWLQTHAYTHINTIVVYG
eukprot:1158172-Pelagomonas_calceolata.AAC.5